jgi:Tim44-like domain
MTVLRAPLVLLLIAIMALAPLTALARAGAASTGRPGLPSIGLSQGSRGSRTYDDSDATAVQRSLTPANATMANTAPAWSEAPTGLVQRHPLLAAIAGGAAGLWLGDVLSGGTHDAYAGTLGQAGGALGSLMTLLVLGGLAWFAWQARRDGIAVAMDRWRGLLGLENFAQAAPHTPLPRAAQPALALTDPDFVAFADVLTQVQHSWSDGDLARLREVVTPEMLSYFAEQLASNQSLDVQNRVEAVMLLRGEAREAWQEGPIDYATALLRWKAFDYTFRLGRQPGDADYLVEGDPRVQTESTEAWTFRRARGGKWLLSAIQQTV